MKKLIQKLKKFIQGIKDRYYEIRGYKVVELEENEYVYTRRPM